MTPRIIMETKFMKEQAGSQSTISMGKVLSKLRIRYSDDGRYHPYMVAMLEDIGKAKTPQELLKLLHDKALNPSNQIRLSETEKAVLICAVGSKLWNLSHKYSRALEVAVRLVLSPSSKSSQRGSSTGEQILNGLQLKDWPGALLEVYKWVQSKWHPQKSLFDVNEESEEWKFEAKMLDVIAHRHQALYNHLPGKIDSFRRMEAERDQADYVATREYEKLREFRDEVASAAKNCAKIQGVYDAQFKLFQKNPVASKNEPASTSAQVTPSAAVKNPTRPQHRQQPSATFKRVGTSKPDCFSAHFD